MRLGIDLGAIDLSQIWKSFQKLPETQRDVESLAAAAREAQAPQTQQYFKEIAEDIEDYGKTTVILQAIIAGAAVASIVIQLRK